MLTQALFASVESGINHLLQLDPVSLQQLAALSGQVLEVQITTPIAFSFLVIPHAHGIQLAQQWAGDADCTLSAPLALLLQLACAKDKTPILHHPEVSLSGNTGLLMQLAEIMQQMDLDWEYRLQQWIGPIASSLISSSLKQQLRWLQDTQQSLEQSAADYAAEEARFLVGQAEAGVRFDEIDQLTQDLDRLTARFAQLTAKDTSA